LNRVLAAAEAADAAAAAAILASRHLAEAAVHTANPHPLLQPLLAAAAALLAPAALLAYLGFRAAAPAYPSAALWGRLYSASLAAAASALAATAASAPPAAAAVVIDASWLAACVARAAAYWATRRERLRLPAVAALVSGAPGPGPKLVGPVALAFLAAALAGEEKRCCRER